MKQGEIWQIGLDPVIGAEMKKTRPGLVINSDTQCFQIRSVSVEKLITQVGSVESEIITQVQEAVNQVIGAW
jgi:mRNA-degrading endonuclease toxin of MazEF toxin-antitoxin module